MRVFTKKETPVREVPSRIKKLSTSELVSWADTTIMLVGKTFDDYRYREEPLDEVVSSVNILSDILHELQNRR